MPAATPTKSNPDLERSLGVEGEQEYCRLLRTLNMARGSFFLFPVESDFTNVLRDALLERLRTDLAAEGCCLRIAEFNRQQWDVFALPDLEAPVVESDVVVLYGLDETPKIAQEAGTKPVRPPALALLNQQRELLHQRVPTPFIVWCSPFIFTTLMKHAPDFFDHFTSLFRFYNAAPVRGVRYIDTLEVTAKGQARVIEESIPLPERIAFYEKQVAELTDPTPERARVLIGLAHALWCQRRVDHGWSTERDYNLITEALTLLDPERNAYDWAHAQNQLGIFYTTLLTGDKKQNLSQAIACYEAALQVRTETNFPKEWAQTQYNLGYVYLELLTGDREQNLRQSISCYEAALRIYTEPDFPSMWAQTQFNRGYVYAELFTGKRGKNLHEAISCYEAALRIYTEPNFPIEWAITQFNLALAYSHLPTGDREQNLRQSISCYEAALRIYTDLDFPKVWAQIRFNLGQVYSILPTGDRGQNLRQAISYYEAALRIYTELDLLKMREQTHRNIADVLMKLNYLEEA